MELPRELTVRRGAASAVISAYSSSTESSVIFSLVFDFDDEKH